MSINPMAYGHTLVVPIAEIDHWVDAPAALAAHLFAVSGHIGRAQQTAFKPTKVGVIIAGYEVPHTHIHVVPTNAMAQLAFAERGATQSTVMISISQPTRSGVRCARPVMAMRSSTSNAVAA